MEPPNTALNRAEFGFFKRFPLRTKILIAPLVSVALFIAYLGFTQFISSSNTARLDQIRDVTFPTLNIANSNVTQSEKITESLNSAAATGEKDMVDAADVIADKLRKDLAEFGKLDGTQKADAEAALQRFGSYYSKAREVSLGVATKQMELAAAGPKMAEMRTELDALNKQLADLRDHTRQKFVDAVEESSAASRRMLVVGMIGAVAVLAASLLAWIVSSAITRNVKSIVGSMRDIATGEGDLTRRIRPETDDEVGELVQQFNAFVSALQNDMRSLVGSLGELESTISTLGGVVTQTELSVQEERGVIADVTTGVGRVLTSIDVVAASADQASRAAAEADDTAKTSYRNIQTTINTINALAQSVEQAFVELGNLRNDAAQIGTVVNTIKGIADQTNLLALNAAIEAARAGEHGRGFAVVADEVRKLSGQTQEATVEVARIVEQLAHTMTSLSSIIESSQSKAVSSVDQITSSGQALEAITEKVGTIRDMNQEIAQATDQQKQGAETIGGRITDLDAVSTSALDQSQALARASGRIRELTGSLQNIAGHFKL